jgi:hypothetical protein
LLPRGDMFTPSSGGKRLIVGVGEK